MTTKELIAEKLKTIQDESVLNEILEMVNLEAELDQEVVALTPEQKLAIQVGLDDIKNGHTSSNDQVNQEIEEWLKKK